MNRKDCDAIADAIRLTRVSSYAYLFTAGEALERVVLEIGDVLLADNPRFDRERFKEACKV